MANSDDQWLKEDGYLNVDAESLSITYHPYLNVILVIGRNSEVKLLDVNSGVILQSYRISELNSVRCRYLPQQDKILIWNGRNICMRGDYNGVLLLDTILQAPVTSTDDRVRLELLLSEALLFLQSLQNLEEHGLENMSDVTNELTQKISEAQSHSKRGIKAQKWETVCLELPHSSLRMVASGVVMQLRRLDQHIPAMAIASAINERLTDLLRGARVNESAKSVQRFQMYSEAARRQTFEAWPHMDYKWVLPDQMAQAGFYHQPGENGNKDRAMCFTCNVCLVCWEKTDEPWSEHERHSPDCPFVKGEFTQNVPLSVTYATSPAVATPGFSLISSGDRGVVFCTGNPSGDVTVWNIERQLTKVHEFQVKLHPDILTTTTISPTATVNSLELSALAAYFVRSPAGSVVQQRRASLSLKPKMLGTKIVAGVRVKSTETFDKETYDVYEHDAETTLLLIVYNIEDPVMEDTSPGSPTLSSNPQAALTLSAGVGGNAKKSNLFTIMESTEDESVKLLAERTNTFMDELKHAKQKLVTQKTNKTKKKHFTDVSENDSSKMKILSSVDALTTLPSTSMNIVTDALATGISSTVPGNVEGGGGEGGGGTGDGGGESVSTMENAIFCIPLQYIELPTLMMDTCSHYYISDTVPSSDNRHLLVVVKYDSDIGTNTSTPDPSATGTDATKDDQQKMGDDVESSGPLWSAVLLLYSLNEDGLVRQDEPLMLSLKQDQVPLEITMLPKCDGTGRHFGGPETDQGIFVMTCADGKLRIVALKTLTIISDASVKDDRFVSATYCKSLERLCGCTAKGCLHFYSFYDLDADSSDERDEEIVVQTSLTAGIDSSDKPYGTTGVDGILPMDVIDNRSSTSTAPSTTGLSNNSGTANTTQQAQHHPDGVGLEWLLAFRQDVTNVNNLKMLHTLTLFSELLTPYSAEVPACWNELEQAQKQRRNPQHLRPGDDTHLTKTWRLHNDASTWDEHLIELNLPKCTSLGHIDFKFSLYQPCANSPAIQVTLLKQKSMGLCTRRKTQSINRVDESINFNIGAGEGKHFVENPVLSEEYLQARNAEIVVGPIELASCMDLSEQGGCVTLTSPKLLKSKGRNYLLHIKTMTDLSKDGQGKTRVPVRKKGITSILLTSLSNISVQSNASPGTVQVGKDGSLTIFPVPSPAGSAASIKTRTNDFYIGCDWLNEISITVRATRQLYKVEQERAQRLAMLDSNMLLENLLSILHQGSAEKASGNGEEENVANSSASTTTTQLPGENVIITQQNLALDILIWIVTIRMMRYRYPKNPFAKRAAPTEVRNVASTDLNVQQTECVQIIEEHLEQTIRHCIVLANRSIAHKCVKFVSLALEGAQNMVDKTACSTFEKSLNDAIIKCLPDIVNSNHAGALRWFALLISGTTLAEHHLTVADHCMKLLESVAEELRKRNNPYSALLRTRFGLHGSPFDSEVFDAQSMDGRIAFGGGAAAYSFGCGSATNGLNMNGGGGNSGGCTSSSKGGGTSASGSMGSSVLTGPSPIDLRLMCFADGADLKCLFDQLRSRTIGSHFMGLLEVEPLHYSCCATSDATRLENIDANGNTTTTSSSSVNGFVAGSGGTGIGNGITIEPVSTANMLMENSLGINAYTVDVKVDVANDQGSHADSMIVSYTEPDQQQPNNSSNHGKNVSITIAPKKKSIQQTQSSEGDKENIGDALMNTVKNVLVDKIFFSALQKHKLKSAVNSSADTIGFPTYLQQSSSESHSKPYAINIGSDSGMLKDIETYDDMSMNDSVTCDVFNPTEQKTTTLIISDTGSAETAAYGADKNAIADGSRSTKAVSFVSNDANLDLQQGPHTSLLDNKIQEYFEEKSTEAENAFDQSGGLPWHKLLSSPAKQTIVVERMHSSAIRYVTLDFGAPIMLTDIIIPAHSDLASLSIDVWCFEEEADSVRLVVSQDIHSRTLVLSDLQPPPICRYLKITITGRYGMTATRCRIPMGSFFGHIVILDREAYADPVMKFLQKRKPNLHTQLKVLKALYDDVHCRYCLASSKLMDLLVPYLNSDASNIAHMQAFLNRMKDTSFGGGLGADLYGTNGTYGTSAGTGVSSASVECAKVTAAYEECIGFQHQLNVIRRVIDRIRPSVDMNHPLLAQLMLPTQPPPLNGCNDLSSIYTDKLRVMSECLIEVVLQLITTYGSMPALGLMEQQIPQQQPHINQDMCNLLFDTMVIAGDAHTQLATCSMLVRMCCFESWWGDFLADKFLTLYSSQNERIFPQDRVFLLLTYLGRRSIAIGRSRTTVIDAILRSLATLLAPLATNSGSGLSIWCSTDLNLLGWILLFLSVCLDDGTEGRKDQNNLRWDFMSGETDMVKARMNMHNSGIRTLTRSFKKRLIQTKQYSLLTGTSSKLEMALKQQENQLKKLTVNIKQSLGDYINEINSKMKEIGESSIVPLSKNELSQDSNSIISSASSSGNHIGSSISSSANQISGTKSSGKFVNLGGDRTIRDASNEAGNSHSNSTSKGVADITGGDGETPFDTGLKAMKIDKIIVVIRGLTGLLLSMDFTCNMDLFLITCKIIARLVLACRPALQLSKIITTNQLLQLVRIAVWENQQQPWAVHAITCLLQDVLEADKSFKDAENESSESPGEEENASTSAAVNPNGASSTLHSMRPPVEVPYKQQQHPLQSTTHHVSCDLSYADVAKNQLPSVVECDDPEMEEILIIDDIFSAREKRFLKRDVVSFASKYSITNKTVSAAMDARLEMGLDTNVEIVFRRLTTRSAFTLISSLPHVSMMPEMIGSTNVSGQPSDSLSPWPDNIMDVWSGPEYLQGIETNTMLTEVFDKILSDLHQLDSWLNLEKILQLWLTLNGETHENLPGSCTTGLHAYSYSRIAFGDRAVRGLLKALATHPNIKLRAWCLGFHCLNVACKPHGEADNLEAAATIGDSYFRRMGNLIVNDENFEKMLLRFFSGADQSMISMDGSSSRYAGPTVCKLVIELFGWLELRCSVKDKLKQTLLRLTLHLVQFGGAIANQQGPIDAQSQMIKELLNYPFDKSDLGIAMSVIECVSHLVYNNVVNVEKLYCQKSTENSNSAAMLGGGMRFSSLFATVFNAESNRACKTATDSSLLVDLLKLASILVNTKNPHTTATGGETGTLDDAHTGSTGVPTVGGDNLNTSSESQTDEIKAEQQHTGVGGASAGNVAGNGTTSGNATAGNSETRPKVPCFTDTVLQHSPTMNRLLSALSHCNHSSLTMLVASTVSYGNGSENSGTKTIRNTHPELCTVADAVFQLLLYLSRTASQNELVVKPLFEYINNASNVRHPMPKLHLSEPFLWFILKVLGTPASVAIFAELGGIQVLCESLVRSNRALINTQPSLVSMIMQRLSKSSVGLHGVSVASGSGMAGGNCSGSSSKKSTPIIATPRNEEGLINFAPYSTITSDNLSVQGADVLIQAPLASHRRARNPAWSYLFYPNESNVDLTITLPTAVLLKEVQLQPHLATLASCPSAVAIEVTRDSILGPIPITQPISTVGMTCIRLRFAQPEIATSVIIRLYRPRDALNIGLTQISVLGTTTFGELPLTGGGPSGIAGSSMQSWPSSSIVPIGGGSGSSVNLKPSNELCNYRKAFGLVDMDEAGVGLGGGGIDDDRMAGAARTSLGWLRILTQCFSVTIFYADQELANRVIAAANEVPGFMEACCALLNIAPNSPNDTLQNLETVLLKLGLHSREMGLRLINTLLRQSIPQTFQLSNDSISDLLYQLCTMQNEHTRDRLQAMLEWVLTLYERYQQNITMGAGGSSVNQHRLALHSTNPYSGFVRCLAAILWQVFATDLIPDLLEMVTRELFDVLFNWLQELKQHEGGTNGPLKKAIDSLLCSVCCIRPEFFTMLLRRMGVLVPNLSTDLTASISDDRKDGERRTDDSKQEESDTTEWYSHLVIEDIACLDLTCSQLSTIAMASQSPLAVQQLIDSGLPKLLNSVILEFCRRAANCVERLRRGPAMKTTNASGNESVSSGSGSAEGCLTDADKWSCGESAENVTNLPMVNIHKVTEILAFFTDMCSEGHMRDWLGSHEGAIFWEPLLLLLCNSHLANVTREITTQSCLELEECFIKFLSRVTTCHPKNQEVLTINLISVIRKSDPTEEAMHSGTADGAVPSTAIPMTGTLTKNCISGFTRRLLLQILLESEKIMVAVRSDLPLLQSKESNGMGAGGLYNSIANHPSKRPNAHLMLFQLSTNAKCQDILDQCAAAVYQPILPSAVAVPASTTASSQPPPAVVTSAGTSAGTSSTTPGGLGGGGDLSLLSGGGNTIATNVSSQSMGGSSSGSSNGPGCSQSELWELGMGLEFLSVAAGVTAKDKRLKEAKNQATTMRRKDLLSMFKIKMDDSKLSVPDGMFLTHSAVPEVIITSDSTISQLLTMLKSAGISLSIPCINLNLIDAKNRPPTDASAGEPSSMSSSSGAGSSAYMRATEFLPLPSPLQIFSSRGGLSLLAHYLPTVYPEIPKSSSHYMDKDRSPPGGTGAGSAGAGNEWVKLEQMDEIYEDLDDIVAESSPKAQSITAIPQHSLAAFALFLKLPAYSEVLLNDTVRAQCLLRLILGVTSDGEGNEIYSLPLSNTLPTLPFEVFRQLLESSPLTTDDGVLLRRMVIEVGAIHLVLNCLSIFTHHNNNGSVRSGTTSVTVGTNSNNTANNAFDTLYQGISTGNGTNKSSSTMTGNATANNTEDQLNADDKGHMYWAKGTGFGTGSTQQSWNVEQALMRQKSEEEHVTVLLQVLSSYINPGCNSYVISAGSEELHNYKDSFESVGDLPPIFLDLIQQSCLIPALSSYLRNDSVLDITRHIPLYRAILQLLRAISVSNQLAMLLVNKNVSEGKLSIAGLLSNMKACVDTYASRLKVNKKSNLKGQTQKIIVSLDDGDDEGLALMMHDIQLTSLLVQNATNMDTTSAVDEGEKQLIPRPITKSVEDKYLEIMKALQFDTYEMIAESENGYRFTISHHFETNVRMAGDRGHPGRVKRLAQETVTLSTSLPLSYSSSVFVRCDTDRLDIMKVLITGPAETPYANGCFEFDVYFPPDYPNSPMMINLETTGRNTVRFNPNLYNDGKVCLSVLNTWHGRPEEKWNAHTSSFLQVLVSIQSLILVPEPYFNEPGFERSRGTPTGTHSSREYNSNIYQACVRYAMLEQLRHPCPCFQDVIHAHFWLKRNEICNQIEEWIAELSHPLQHERAGRTISFNAMVLRRQYRQLREELAKLTPPEGLEEADYPFNAGSNITPTTPSAAATTATSATLPSGATLPTCPSCSLMHSSSSCSSSSSSTSSSSSSSSSTSSSSSSASSSSSNSSAHSQQAAPNVADSNLTDGDGSESGGSVMLQIGGVSNSVEDDAEVKDGMRDGNETDSGSGVGMMTEEVAVVFSDHSEEQGSEINVHSGTGSAGGGDCSESSSSGSSIVTGVSAGSVDNSSSESTAVTGGLSEELAGSNQLPTADDISSINSIEKPISSSVHESLDDDADLSLEEMALSII